MRITCLSVLLLFIVGCGSTIQPKPIFVEIENFELQGEPDFVIRPKNEKLRKYGYSDFCTYKPNVRSTDCGQFRSPQGYNLLVNKKGIFLDEDIVYWSNYTFFPVQLENGSKFYLSTYKNNESTPFNSSEIIDNQNHTYLLSIVNKPIRNGSTLSVKDINLDFVEGVKLSNDKNYRLDTYRNLLSILQFFPDFTDDLAFFNKMHEKIVKARIQLRSAPLAKLSRLA